MRDRWNVSEPSLGQYSYTRPLALAKNTARLIFGAIGKLGRIDTSFHFISPARAFPHARETPGSSTVVVISLLSTLQFAVRAITQQPVCFHRKLQHFTRRHSRPRLTLRSWALFGSSFQLFTPVTQDVRTSSLAHTRQYQSSEEGMRETVGSKDLG